MGFLPVFGIQMIAQACGMISNFIIQRNFIFQKNRTISASILWSFSFSILSIVLAGSLVHFLYKVSFFQEYPVVMKVCVSAIFFLFNFYTKQYAFEKKFKL